MSGDKAEFFGDNMAAVVQSIEDVHRLIGRPPVVIGGLAVLCRLSRPYRATTDLDVVDRLLEGKRQLEILRASAGAKDVEPAAVLLPTRFGNVKVDVLEVQQFEIDDPSDDPGDRLHAAAHAWAYDTSTPVELHAIRADGEVVRVTTYVAEPGPLVAMKLQAVMNRGAAKQGTDLHDIVRLTLDPRARERLTSQLANCEPNMGRDITLHVNLWFGDRRTQSFRWIQSAGGAEVGLDDLNLVRELLSAALA